VEEALLLIEQRRARGRLALDRPQRVLAAASVPDHRKEHRSHERHLEEFAPELLAGEGVVEDEAAGCEDDHANTNPVARGSHTRKP